MLVDFHCGSLSHARIKINAQDTVWQGVDYIKGALYKITVTDGYNLIKLNNFAQLFEVEIEVLRSIISSSDLSQRHAK